MRLIFTLTASLLLATTATAGEICYEGAKFTFGAGDISFEVLNNTPAAIFTHPDGNFCMISGTQDLHPWGQCGGVDLEYKGQCAGTTSGKHSPVISNVQGGVTITIAE